MPFSPHPAFEAPAPDQTLWRYMDFPRFYSMMTRKSLYLSSLANLTNDPWEGLPTRPYFDPDGPVVVCNLDSREDSNGVLQQITTETTMTQVEFFEGRKNLDAWTAMWGDVFRKSKKTVFVNCWHMSDTESEALWKIYGGSGYGISIRSTYKRLEDSLTGADTIYAGKVAYLDETIDQIGVNNMFYACMWKRRSFAHEREFRVVVDDHHATSPGVLLPIDINRLIEDIIVHPEAADWFLEIVKEIATSAGCDASVRRSELLNEPNYIWPQPSCEAG